MCILSRLLLEKSFRRATMNQQFTSCATAFFDSYLFSEVQIFNPLNSLWIVWYIFDQLKVFVVRMLRSVWTIYIHPA